MLNVDKVRAYLSNLNTMDVIWLGNRLGDQKAKLLRENKQPSEAFLTVLVQGPYFYLAVGTLLVVFFWVVVAVVALQMHWGMLCEVLGDRTGSYILSQ